MEDLDWTDELLSDTREVVMELLSEPPDDAEGLVREVVAKQARIHELARPLTDLETADALADATVALLRRPDLGSGLRLAAVAARYYVRDPADDLASPYGFDDDVEVFNAVAARLAPDLVLADP